MTNNVVSLRGDPVPIGEAEPWLDAAVMLEALAGRVRAGEVVGVGVAFVDVDSGLPQVVANWSFASGHRYNMAVATALLDHRFKQQVFDQ